MPLIDMPEDLRRRRARPRRRRRRASRRRPCPGPPTSTWALMTTLPAAVEGSARYSGCGPRLGRACGPPPTAGPAAPGRAGASWRRPRGSSRARHGTGAAEVADRPLSDLRSAARWRSARLGDPLQRRRRLRDRPDDRVVEAQRSSSSKKSARPAASASVARRRRPRPARLVEPDADRAPDRSPVPPDLAAGRVEPREPPREPVVDPPEPGRVPGIRPAARSGPAFARPSTPRGSAAGAPGGGRSTAPVEALHCPRSVTVSPLEEPRGDLEVLREPAHLVVDREAERLVLGLVPAPPEARGSAARPTGRRAWRPSWP